MARMLETVSEMENTEAADGDGATATWRRSGACPRDLEPPDLLEIFVGSLVSEFSRASGSGPALDRWFSELDVSCVLRNDQEEEEATGSLVGRWARALTVMARALIATLQDQEDNLTGRLCQLGRLMEASFSKIQLAQFAQATFSKMLAFANALADKPWTRPTDKFSGLMQLRICINDVSDILVPLYNEDELEKKSKLFSDHSLRYLFLLNNSYVVQYQFLVPSDYSPPSEIKFHYEQYQKEYMRASWEPVLSCLHDKMPPCFPKLSSHSELSRFELEFEKTCSHQKLWKVPLPNLRQSLRETIINKIITRYKKYMEDHPEQEKCGRDPLDMEGMVNDLFEG
ncbi:hypothetical protein OsJ_18285 [Oryza sativa Japonica Group]|uniref:Exocyst subunit Exo70 family protein n=1 Tax=Oryza sativa subsp. japonica TaxID=39947 RepID=B9FP79_ORYSJ|nr:hypothetical protein OsJ_18285 [Oryza sativa Japonica Group]